MFDPQEPFTVPAATPTTPITVSIRLTAALIIRNVATISSDARRYDFYHHLVEQLINGDVCLFHQIPAKIRAVPE
jgi:hypothetical protein